MSGAGKALTEEDMSKTSLSGNTLLHVAARSGDEPKTSFLAKNHPSMIMAKNSKGDTPLHVAARAQMITTVNILVKYCADKSSLMELKNKKGNTALHDALYVIREASADAMNKSKDKHDDSVDSAVALARVLVTVDPEACYVKNIADKSPLCLAVESENTEILKYILQALPRYESCVSNIQGKSPVRVAIELKHLGMLETMQEERPNLLLTQDEQGNTPMHWAASVGYLEGVNYLHKINGDSVNQRNRKGHYPFHHACANNHVKVMDIFFDDENNSTMPVPTELFNYKGQSILHVAAKKGRFDAVRRILSDRNSSDKLIHEVDDNGNTPLHLAALKARHVVAASLIWDGRAKWNITNHHGFTAYDIAEQEAERINPEFPRHQFEEDEIPKKVDDQHQNISKSEPEPTDENKNKRKPKTDSYQMMMTLSLLVVVRNCYLIWHSKGTFLGNLFEVIGNLYKESNQRPKRKDVENRITNLIVVAALIAGVAFAASVQMASSSDSDSSPSDNETAFIFFNTVAMYTSITAAIILCWAQIHDTNIASIDVFFASLMVMAALYNSCLAYIFTIFILCGSGSGNGSTLFTVIMTVTQGIFLFIVAILSFQLVIPLSLKKLYILSNYFLHLWFFYSLNRLWSSMKKTSFYAKYVEGKEKKLE